MNFFPLFIFLSAVFCGKRPRPRTSNSSSNINSNANANIVNKFMVESLPHIISLSKMTKYYSRRLEGISVEELRRYSLFFKEVKVHFDADKSWEGTFRGVCNNHADFNEAYLFQEAEKAVLAAYNITVDNDKEAIKSYLQDLCRQRQNEEGFVLDVEVMYLFLTYLAHCIQAPFRSSAFVAESPRKRLRTTVSAMSPIIMSSSTPQSENPPLGGDYGQPQPYADYPPHPLIDASDAMSDEEVESEKCTSVSTAPFSSDETLKSDVKAISNSSIEELFYLKEPIETVESSTIRCFMEFVETDYKKFESSKKKKLSIESNWFNVLKGIVKANFSTEIEMLPKAMSLLDAVNIILRSHGLELPDSNTLTADIKTIMPAAQKLFSKQLEDPEFTLRSRPRALFLFAYLAYSSPKSFIEADSEDSNDARSVEEVEPERDAIVVKLPIYSLKFKKMRKDLSVLNSPKYENFFKEKKSFKIIKRKTIKAFMKFVKPLYEASNATSIELGTIWTNVCKEIVARKFSILKPATLKAIRIILKDHNLELPELNQAKNFKRGKPLIEGILQASFKRPSFKLKNYPRTFLILSYLAYYSPAGDDALSTSSSSEEDATSEDMDVEEVASEKDVKEIKLPKTFPYA